MGKRCLANLIGEIGAFGGPISESGPKTMHRYAVDLHAEEHHFERAVDGFGPARGSGLTFHSNKRLHVSLALVRLRFVIAGVERAEPPQQLETQIIQCSGHVVRTGTIIAGRALFTAGRTPWSRNDSKPPVCPGE